MTEDKPLKLVFLSSAFEVHGSARSFASFRRRRGIICSANGGRYPFPLRQYTSQQKRFIHKKEPLSSASAPYADRMKADGTRHRLSFYPVSHTSHVHGGSVSRRGLNQLYRRVLSTLRRNQASRNAQLKRQPLFGREGSGGRGASLREAASPPRISRYPSHISL